MRTMSRVLLALFAVCVAISFTGCVGGSPAPVPTFTKAAVPLVTACPEGILEVLSARPDIDLVREIPAVDYPGPDAAPDLDIGRPPSCAFELTVNKNHAVLHYAYYMGENVDFVARLGGILAHDGFLPGNSNVVDGGYWGNGEFGVAIAHFSSGVYDEYPNIEFTKDFVFIW